MPRVIAVGVLLWMMWVGLGDSARAYAQQPTPTAVDSPTLATIGFDVPVQETITDRAIFDRWTFSAAPGSIVLVSVQGAEGLAPLVGLGNVGGDLLYSSDGQHEGLRVDAEPNALVAFEYPIEVAGEYVIIVTRAGNETGTTTGSYTLLIRQATASVAREETYQDVVFRCGADEVTTAATLQWAQEAGEAYRISVYGLDGFRPLIRVVSSSDPANPLDDCAADAQDMGGDRFTLPGEAEVVLPEDAPVNAARFSVSRAFTDITLTVGSIGGAPGRYVLVIEGFTLAPAREIDSLTARIGPLAARTTDMRVYMVRREATRLDPFLQYVDAADAVVADCDDAGRRTCAEVPAITGMQFAFSAPFGDLSALSGDTLDAGLRLMPGGPEPMGLLLTSLNRAEGGYALVILGTLPPRSEG